jgi:hypothetical protein
MSYVYGSQEFKVHFYQSELNMRHRRWLLRKEKKSYE